MEAVDDCSRVLGSAFLGVSSSFLFFFLASSHTVCPEMSQEYLKHSNMLKWLDKVFYSSETNVINPYT